MLKSDKIKGFAAGIITTGIISVSLSAFAGTVEKQIKVVYNDIKISINGKQITPKDANGNTVEPFSYNGTVYLPVRAISQALGSSVSWNADTNTVSIEAKSAGQNGSGGMNRPDMSQMKERIKSSLSTLVSDGTLTQEKADKLLTYFENDTTNQNPGESGERIDPFGKAVSDGVITQAEADTIRNALMPSKSTRN